MVSGREGFVGYRQVEYESRALAGVMDTHPLCLSRSTPFSHQMQAATQRHKRMLPMWVGT